MTANFTLRAAQTADSARILQLERQLFGPTAWTPGMLADELGGSGRWYLVAEDNTSDQVGGYAGIWVNGEVGEVMTIGVDPINHRQGLGRALMQALIDHAIIVGAKELFLEVQVDNLPAVTLYKSLGFECLGIRKRYYQDKDAYTMRLQLV